MANSPGVLLQQLLNQDLNDHEEKACDESRPLYHRFACRNMRRTLLSKFADDGLATADQAAIDLFLVNNERVRSVQLPSLGLHPSQDCDPQMHRILTDIREHLWRFFHYDRAGLDPVLTVEEILFNGDFGPGASQDASGTDFVAKIGCSTMSYSSGYWLEAWKHLACSNPTTCRCENHRDLLCGARRRRSSKLNCVPKKAEISRTIATENLLDMYVQKGIGKLISDRLASVHSLDLTDQPAINRTLARIGSWEGGFGTIDLSMASDSISLQLLRALFPRNVAEILLSASVRYTLLPDGREVELGMVSTMGNGFTFPLQTLLFTEVVKAVYRELRIDILDARRGYRHDTPVGCFVADFERLPNWAVFGDDIIVDDEAYHLVVAVLSQLGFVVNNEKSYSEGPFRESCGGDYYHGHQVRGVYIKTLKTPHDFDIAFNLVYEWCCDHGVHLKRVLSYLYQRSTKVEVPLWSDVDHGVRTPFSLVTLDMVFNGSRRWHQVYGLCGSLAYQGWRARSKKFRYSEEVDRIGLLDAAHYLAFLKGVLRDGVVSVRETRASYTKRWIVIPNWDAPPDGVLVTAEKEQALHAYHPLVRLGKRS